MAFMKEKLVNLCSLIGLRLALSPPNQYSCCNFSFIYWYFVIFLPILIHRKELQLFSPHCESCSVSDCLKVSYCPDYFTLQL